MTDTPARQVHVNVACLDADGRQLAVTVTEQLEGAFALLQRAVDAGATGASAPTEGEWSAGEAFAAGVRLIVHALPHIETEQRIALMRHVAQLAKHWLPVEVRWRIFDDGGDVIGDVQEHMSQHEAAERFGLGR